MSKKTFDLTDPQSFPIAWLIEHAEAGRTDGCMLAIDRGISPNSRGPNGELPLLQAVHKGHPETAFALIKRGADVLDKDDKGNSVLHTAHRLSPHDIGRLIDLGADVNACNNTNTTPLMCVDTNEQLEVLLARGADPNIAHNNGQTPFMNASVLGSPDRCMLLARFGADVNAHNHAQSAGTALHRCMMKNSMTMGAVLVALGAKPPSRHSGRNDEWRRLMDMPPLHAAARSGHLPLVLSLAKDLKDLDAKHRRKTPEMVAQEFRNMEVVAALQSIRAQLSIDVALGAPRLGTH